VKDQRENMAPREPAALATANIAALVSLL